MFRALLKRIGLLPSALPPRILGHDPEQSLVYCEVPMPNRPGDLVPFSSYCGREKVGRVRWFRRANAGSMALAAVEFSSPLSVQEPSPKELLATRFRQHQRRSVRLWTTFPGSELSATATLDLSVGGFRIPGCLEGMLGRTLQVWMEMPLHVDPLRVEAEVVWSRSDESGLRFRNLSLVDEKRLLETLQIDPPQPNPTVHCTSKSVNRYRFLQKGDKGLLTLTLENWKVLFILRSPHYSGPSSGVFSTSQSFESSSELLALRTSQKISLQGRKHPVHLVLENEFGETVFEAWGVEERFSRVRRRASASSGGGGGP